MFQLCYIKCPDGDPDVSRPTGIDPPRELRSILAHEWKLPHNLLASTSFLLCWRTRDSADLRELLVRGTRTCRCFREAVLFCLLRGTQHIGVKLPDTGTRELLLLEKVSGLKVDLFLFPLKRLCSLLFRISAQCIRSSLTTSSAPDSLGSSMEVSHMTTIATKAWRTTTMRKN